MSLKEISAAEDLMKVAINNQSHVDSLIGYYRDKIDDFNKERAEWVINYDVVQQNSNDQYLLNQQVNKENVNLTELKSKLAMITAELNAERQKYFKFFKENEEGKKRLQESKKNYRELVNSCKPVNLNSKHLNNSSVYSVNGKKNIDDTKLSVMKETGNSKTTNLELELINLKKEHNVKKNQLREKINFLKDELDELLDEYSDRSQYRNSQYRAAFERLADLQNKHMSLTKQFFKMRTNNVDQEQKLEEENEIIRMKNMAIVQKLKSLEKAHQDEFKTVDSQVKKQNKEFKNKYDNQLKKKEEHLTILKEQHERLQDIYLTKMKRLQEELKTTNSKRQQVEEKGRVQISSLKSQIKILKGRLQKGEVQQMREDLINDQEEQSSMSLEVSELDKINKEVKNIEKQLNLKK